MRRSSPQPPTPTKSQSSSSEEPQSTPPPPLQVDTWSRYLGRHSPHLSAVLVCSPGLGPPAYLIAAEADSTRLLSPRPASPLPNPLLATARCTHCTAQLHQSVLSSSSNSSFPPLHIPIQSNPTRRPLLLPSTNTCPHFLPSLNRKSQTLFSPLVQPCGHNIRSIANRPSYCPTVCQTSPSETGDPPAQSSPCPAQPTSRPRDIINPPPPVTRPPSIQPPPQSATLPSKHC